MTFPQSVLIWSARSSAGVLSSPESTQLSSRRFYSADEKVYEVCFVFLQQDFAPAHCTKTTGNLFATPSITVASQLVSTEPHREYTGYCPKEDERHRTGGRYHLVLYSNILRRWIFFYFLRAVSHNHKKRGEINFFAIIKFLEMYMHTCDLPWFHQWGTWFCQEICNWTGKTPPW